VEHTAHLAVVDGARDRRDQCGRRRGSAEAAHFVRKHAGYVFIV
jgi:hypothetical protein